MAETKQASAKKTAEQVATEKSQKAKSDHAKVISKRVNSKEDAANLLDKLGIDPPETYQSKEVTHAYVTTDCNVFWTRNQAHNHAKKIDPNKRIFVVKL